MCTATWMATEGRFRLYFNRDELRSRGPARPPERLEREGTAILAPIDGDRGGSWIAANEHGLVACLLNGYVEESDPAAAAPEPDGGWTSRGELVLDLLAEREAAPALARLDRLELSRFRTFVLALFAPDGEAQVARWLDGTLRLGPAVMPLSSSSYETAAVIGRRRERWEREAPGGELPLDRRHRGHVAYHASREADSGAHSVCMSRPDAATRSFTWVDVDADRVTLHYLDAPPCAAGDEPWQTLSLNRRP